MINSEPKIAESFLYEVWKRQLLVRESLVAANGRKVKIMCPGERNTGDGPDFCNAVVEVEGIGLLIGDVELHRHTGEWKTHRHHRDPKYNSVILHVVMWHKSKDKTSTLMNGSHAQIVPLEGQLSSPLTELHWLVESSASFHPTCIGGNCYLYEDSIAQILDEAGYTRFFTKVEGFRRSICGRGNDQVLYEGFMGALGYTKNKGAFHQLATVLPLCIIDSVSQDVPRDKSRIYLESLLLGTAGLLPEQRDFEADSWACYLQHLWRELDMDQKMKVNDWSLFRVRPDNFPVRRLAAASRLLCRYQLQDILEGLFSLMYDACYLGEVGNMRDGIMVVVEEGYWANHYDFGVESRWNPTLLGRTRADEIIVNVIFPFFYAWSTVHGEQQLKESILVLYGEYPRLGGNRITRYMEKKLFGRSSALVNSALKEQGLIGLYNTFCVSMACMKCPINRFSRRFCYG
ncbi:MAG: DUF2851 family protein [Chloroflexota bacterium]|nr:DUF2851 family protein [Chloroflexota bacterium]